MKNTKTIRISTSYTAHINGATALRQANVYGAFVGRGAVGVNDYYALEFNTEQIRKVIEDWHKGTLVDLEIKSVAVEISHQHSRTYAAANSFQILRLENQPSVLSDWDLVDAIQTVGDSNNLGYFELDSGRRTKTIVFLTSDANDPLLTAIAGGTYFSIAIRPSALIPTSLFGVDMGGLTLVYGDGESWRAAEENEAIDPPQLIVRYSYTIPDHTSFGLYYTTVDPTTVQSTPVNSVGGHKSINTVYETTWLTSSIGTTDTSADVFSTIDDDATLIQIGPEIAGYVKTDRGMLLTRGVSPAALPSTVDPVPESVRYINIDRLFDTKPISRFSQYRCVAISNQGTTTTNLKLSVLQKRTSDVQIDIGIEVPEHDSYSGSHKGSNGSGVIQDDSFPVGTPDGKYNGSSVIVNSDPSRIGVITSFEYSDSVGMYEISFSGTLTSIDTDETYVILPAPSQIAVNDISAPQLGTLFSGFIGDGASTHVLLQEHGVSFRQNDLFYLWIKRVFNDNATISSDTGAIIAIQHLPPGAPDDYESHILGVWTFDRTPADQYLMNDFENTGGISSYSLLSKYDLLANRTITKYGLKIEENATWMAESVSFSTHVGGYKMSMGFWWYSPRAVGRTRHVITRETTGKIAPIIAKANSTIVDDIESISIGEWVVCEVGITDTANAIRLYLNGDFPDLELVTGIRVFESQIYLPGLHHVYIAYETSGDGQGIVSIEIDGKSIQYHLEAPVLSETIAPLRINEIGVGPVAHKTVQSDAVISDLVLRSDFVDLGDSANLVRYGWEFVTSSDTFYDKFDFVGLGYHQPTTISTTALIPVDSDIVVARSNGEIYRGTRPGWDVEHNFDDNQILPLLRPQNAAGVTIANSQLTITGTSIRIP